MLGEQAQQIPSLRVQAISLDGGLHEVVMIPERVAVLGPTNGPALPPPTPVDRARRTIQMYCDDIILSSDGTLVASGWAACVTAIAAVEVYFDGELMGQAELGSPRLDVAQQHPDIAMARFSGFLFKKRVRGNVAGEHQVVVVARNGLDDTRAETHNVTASEPVAAPRRPAHSESTPFESKPAFLLYVDQPTVRDGMAAEIMSGHPMTIVGWALATSPVAAIAVFIDDEPVGEAKYGLTRGDVAAAFPDHADALHSGHIYYCPLHSLGDGKHTVRVEGRATNGEVAANCFTIEIRKTEEVNDYAQIRRHILPQQADHYPDILDRLDYHPRFRPILHETTRLGPVALEATLHSLASQVYDGWRLTLKTKAGKVACALCAQSQERQASSDTHAVDAVDKARLVAAQAMDQLRLTRVRLRRPKRVDNSTAITRPAD